MSDVRPDAKAIFLQALDCAGAEALVRHLEQACGHDAALRARVEELLQAHREAGAFLGGTGAGAVPIPELPGTVIGPYTLLELIGEGGMGIVFIAEQQQPVRRSVALKLIKPGMYSKEVVARFEAERQVLAWMDHPNIAKVLDAGTTEAGRPYFVMELVRGIPITEFCDQTCYTIRQRLELFIQVCRAVQHAHTKGIIHRDIKPTNVLVTTHDGMPVPMVIDFGVAKALGGQLTEHSTYTGFAQMVGTPLYMSPEQAEFSQAGVDTRSDVYSLGVMLYELLTGATPFDKERLRTVDFGELRRILREEEPPRASARLGNVTAELAAASQRRGVELPKLTQTVDGELDWIALKALQKDRNRRYESASAFAADVQRYLNDEPVHACPPSAGYRMQKFVRRNKATVMAAAFITLALMGGTIGTSIGLARAESALESEEYQRGLAEANEAKLKLALAEVQENYQRTEAERLRAETNFREAFWCIEHVLNAFDPNRNMGPITVAELRRYQTDEALRFLKLFQEQSSNDPAIRLQQGAAYVHAGRIYQVLAKPHESQRELRQAIAVFGRLVAELPEDAKYPVELCRALHILAEDLYAAGEIQETNEVYGQCKRAIHVAVQKHPKDIATLQRQTGILLDWPDPDLRDPSTALEFAKMAVALDQNNPRSWLGQGVAHYRCGEWEAAEQALETSRRLLKEGDWTKAKIACFLAMTQRCRNKPAEAMKSYREALGLMEKNFDARNLALLAEAAAALGIEGPPGRDLVK